MAGKQVLEVPPTNVGGSPFCVAVCFRGTDIQKVCVRSTHLTHLFAQAVYNRYILSLAGQGVVRLSFMYIIAL